MFLSFIEYLNSPKQFFCCKKVEQSFEFFHESNPFGKKVYPVSWVQLLVGIQDHQHSFSAMNLPVSK